MIWCLGGVALMAAVTRAIALSTGRDFVFGLVPAFDPAGSRNLVAWVSSMLFGIGAGLMYLVAHASNARGDRPAGWAALSGALALCSLAGMTGVAGLLPQAVVATGRPTLVLVVTALAAAAAILMMVRQQGSMPVPGVIWAGLALTALSHFAPMTSATGIGAALALLGRVLQWTGAVLLSAGAVALVFDRSSLLVQVATSPGPSLAVRHDARATAITLNPVAVTTMVAWCVVGLASVSLLVAWPAAGSIAGEGWYRFFFVDFEGNAPSWFSALLLLACGIVAAGIASAARSRADSDWRTWALVAAGLVVFSADEAASLHELLVVPLRALVGGSPWLRYPLVLPGTIVVLGAVMVLGRFVWRLPDRTRRAVIRGGTIFVFGALGLETVGGWYDPELYGESVTYVLLATAEEVCEMAGVTTVLAGLLRHLEHHVGALELRAASPIR